MLTNIIKTWPILFLGLISCNVSAPSGDGPLPLPQPSSTPTSTPVWSTPTPRPTLPPLPELPDIPAGTLVKCERKTGWQSPTALAVSPDGKTAYVLDTRNEDSHDYWSEQDCATREYDINPYPTPLASANLIPCEKKLPPPTMEHTIYKITVEGLSLWQNAKGQCFQDIGSHLQDDTQGHLSLFLKDRLFQVSSNFNLMQEKDLSPAYKDFQSLIDKKSDFSTLDDLYIDQKNQIFFSLAQIRNSSRHFLTRFYRLNERGLAQPIKVTGDYSTLNTATIAHDANRNILYALGLYPELSAFEGQKTPFKPETLIQAGFEPGKGVDDARVLKDGRVVVIGKRNTLFLLDHKNQTIVRLAGGKYGYRDGQGAEALFGELIALDLDDAENIYVLDAGNKAIRKVTLAGKVTTFYRQTP